PGLQPTPWSACRCNPVGLDSATRGSRADEGVCPTNPWQICLRLGSFLGQDFILGFHPAADWHGNPPYSALIHFTASTADALLAGRYDAASVAINNVKGTAVNVIGSMGATPNNSDFITCVRAAAAPMPIIMPIAQRRRP